jgi:protein-tyrosine phosphatase
LIEPVRPPRQVAREDFETSARIVAMSEGEHRSMMSDLFPTWADAVEYWDVEDLDLSPVEAALKRLSALVHALRSQLRRAD